MPQVERITISEAATILGESRWTTQRRVRRGQLSATQIGGGTNPYLLNRREVERLARTLKAVSS